MAKNALSIFQCGFRKKYSTQHALIAMIEKARKILNKGATFGALLTDLLKAFDCMIHDDIMMSCFCGMVDRRKALLEILTIANLRHVAIRI